MTHNGLVEIAATTHHTVIIGYKNDKLENVGFGCLKYNENLINLDLPVLKEVGDCFLYANINKYT